MHPNAHGPQSDWSKRESKTANDQQQAMHRAAAITGIEAHPQLFF